APAAPFPGWGVSGLGFLAGRVSLWLGFLAGRVPSLAWFSCRLWPAQPWLLPGLGACPGAAPVRSHLLPSALDAPPRSDSVGAGGSGSPGAAMAEGASGTRWAPRGVPEVIQTADRGGAGCLG